MAFRARLRSARNSSGLMVKTRTWSQPWLAISCPAAAIRRISAGCRSATQPRVKKVPITPASSNKASTASALASTRRGKVSQSSREMQVSKAPTWNQSSTSTDRAFSMSPALPAASGGVGVTRRLLAVLDPIDEEGQDAADDRFLLLGPRFQRGDPPLQGQIADAGLRRSDPGCRRGLRRVGGEIGDDALDVARIETVRLLDCALEEQ